MRNKILTILAMALFISAFLLQTTAFASSSDDITAPTLTARLSGETLHIEAKDENSGVESVYIDGHKVSYPTKGTLDTALWNYAGTGQYVSVYAVDFSGNHSGTVQVENPYYKAASTATNTSTASTTKSSESAVPTQTNAFTPEGTGTTVDNATDSDGKEFYTITTPDKNVFYLIIDRQREDGNVYFLNAVTEDDLNSLAKKETKTTSGESAVPTPQATSQAKTTTVPDTASEKQPEKGSDSTMIFVLVAVVVAGGAGYYFKIYKPKHQAADMEDEDFDEEENDYEKETGSLPEQEGDTDDFLSSEDDFGEYVDDSQEDEDKE